MINENKLNQCEQTKSVFYMISIAFVVLNCWTVPFLKEIKFPNFLPFYINIVFFFKCHKQDFVLLLGLKLFQFCNISLCIAAKMHEICVKNFRHRCIKDFTKGWIHYLLSINKEFGAEFFLFWTYWHFLTWNIS